MDPDALIALLAGGGSAVLVLGAGAWAYVRSRGRTSSTDDSAGTTSSDGTGESGGSDAESSTTATAVKERPAAPSWADTLSAPTTAPPAGEPSPAPAEEPAAEGEPAGAASSSTLEERPADEEASSAPDAETSGPAPVEEPADESATVEHPGTGAPVTAPEPEDTEVAPAPEPEAAAAPAIETPEAPESRMVRLRARLARSGSLGRGILTLLTRGSIDESTWDEIEETLLLADLGPDATDEMLENLRRRIQVLGTDDPQAVREVLREELLSLIDPALDRRLAASRRTAPDGTELPSVLLMVGVNGTGKTTTVGKLARVLVAADRTVVLGAADTFRAAAAEQLATWGDRVGVDTVRSDRDGADPAAVAFDAVKEGIEQEVDVVIVDTAGRLQNKKGLMDELGKVRRVAEKGLHGDEVAEVLLVIDATTGQNGMQQARVFSEAVNITGIVLTKLDGTAKGGIVVNVQRELGVPVKMVGLGEGMDDLTPFDPHGFVDALLEG
ncbi:signal recognition particle-docking protein FtsY [Brachybacterium sp. YJGR34]|uniref:signal recognition particle-docking protein FtsY n=1 Tax=Brachybacterium sp. YJGR34 TaxID=2059911 RepID=UPI000E0A7007|nr:signal recognition particle-docking protein FtsY [Brachybacterium sp. YJGR34]